jgi:hypothetical protein
MNRPLLPSWMLLVVLPRCPPVAALPMLRPPRLMPPRLAPPRLLPLRIDPLSGATGERLLCRYRSTLVGDAGYDWSDARDTEAEREPRCEGGAGKSKWESLRIFLTVLAAVAESGMRSWGSVRFVEVVPIDSRDVSWAKPWPDGEDVLGFKELVRGAILGALGTGGTWLPGNI